LIVSAIALSSAAAAATVNVDFGNEAVFSGQGAMASTGNLWNGVATAGNPTAASDLLDSTGAATTVDVSVLGAGGVLAATNSAEAGLANDLTRDGFRGLDNDPASHLTLTIGGLTPAALYDVALYGVQDATFGGFLSNNRGSTFDIGGNQQTSTADSGVWLAGGFTLGATHVARATSWSKSAPSLNRLMRLFPWRFSTACKLMGPLCRNPVELCY
jgi:hypothetical protein